MKMSDTVSPQCEAERLIHSPVWIHQLAYRHLVLAVRFFAVMANSSLQGCLINMWNVVKKVVLLLL